MDLNEARIRAGLKPLPHTKPQQPELEAGHARGATTTHRLPGQHPELRGIPLVGAGPGVITGTQPGPNTSSADLEQAGRDILKANLHRNRFKDA